MAVEATMRSSNTDALVGEPARIREREKMVDRKR